MGTTLSDPATTTPSSGAAGPHLPGPTLVGTTNEWIIPGTDGELITVTADFIGWASSRSRTHWDHTPGTFAPRGHRCRACRWFEPRIFRECRDEDDHEPERFLVHSAGMTIVPGERVLTKHSWALSGDEVLDLLATRREREQQAQVCPVCHGSGMLGKGNKCRSCKQGVVYAPGSEVFYSVPARRVIAQAAGLDEELAEAKLRRGL